jgi:hypothetical protein
MAKIPVDRMLDCSKKSVVKRLHQLAALGERVNLIQAAMARNPEFDPDKALLALAEVERKAAILEIGHMGQRVPSRKRIRNGKPHVRTHGRYANRASVKPWYES